MDRPKDILKILDESARAMTFPALNNGYVYPAASRISLHRSRKDWSIVFECFGFSPRAFTPYTFLTTFGSRPYARKTSQEFRDGRAFEQYLRAHPHDDSEAVFPLEAGDWHDENDVEIVQARATSVQVRGRVIPLPDADAYLPHGIALVDPPRIQVFELCRYLAAIARSDVLATPAERRVHVNPELAEILVLDEWYQPDTIADELPSATATFQQFADVLTKGDVGRYRPSEAPNTHWSNWPEAGTL